MILTFFEVFPISYLGKFEGLQRLTFFYWTVDALIVRINKSLEKGHSIIDDIIRKAVRLLSSALILDNFRNENNIFKFWLWVLYNKQNTSKKAIKYIIADCHCLRCSFLFCF